MGRLVLFMVGSLAGLIDRIDHDPDYELSNCR
jgi:hypothetical protein